MISTCSTSHKAQPATNGERRKSWELLGTAHHFLRGGSWTSIENLLGGKRKNVDTVPNGKGGWDKDGDFSNRNWEKSVIPQLGTNFTFEPYNECVFINFIISFPGSVLRHDNSKWNDWQNSWDWRDSSWQAGRILDAFNRHNFDIFLSIGVSTFQQNLIILQRGARWAASLCQDSGKREWREDWDWPTWEDTRKDWHMTYHDTVPSSTNMGLANLGRHQKGLTHDISWHSTLFNKHGMDNSHT